MALSANQSAIAIPPPTPVPPDFPAPLSDMLRRATHNTHDALGCTTDLDYARRTMPPMPKSKTTDHYASSNKAKTLDIRLEDARKVAEGIWGGTAPAAPYGVPPIKGCSDNRVKKSLEWAERDIAAFEQALQPYLTAMGQGLWIGTIPLCASSVQMAAPGIHQDSAEPIVDIKLSKPAARRFAEITQASVSRTLAVRFKGAVLMAPTINEPILVGAAQITGMEQDDINRIIEATKAPCE